ncbi:MAG: hypothetical protein JOZ22_26815, partial [Acidobacteriia bacterium]|nr:hypothetical protein [Terriglobia bacterium]
MRLAGRLTLAGVLVGLWGIPAFGDTVDSLWLGTLTRISTGFQDVFRVDTTGNVLTQVSDSSVSGQSLVNHDPYPITGIATDGTSLYFADSFGWIVKTTLDGSTVISSPYWPYGPDGNCSQTSYPCGTQEGMAWDSTRSVLWRVTAATDVLEEINPATNAYNGVALSLGQFNGWGARGVAYDSQTDQVLVSLCDTGGLSNCPATDGSGVVVAVDPSTYAVTPLFTTSFDPGGLAYDASNNSLWVTDISDCNPPASLSDTTPGVCQIHDLSVNGAALSAFNQPSQDGYITGLAF